MGTASLLVFGLGLCATHADAQAVAVDGDKAYLAEGGVLVKVDLDTMQVEERLTFWRGPGPWDNRLVLASSADGLIFRDTDQVLVEAGGVPDLVRDGQGRIIAIYQYFPADDEAAFDKMAVSISTDEGKTWQKPQVITIAGTPATADHGPCDPDLVLLPDGRLRLYFTYNVHDGQRGFPRTVSALSTGGMHYELEAGDRLADPPNPVLDPSVVRIGDRWHLFSQCVMRFGVNYHAVSGDGLHFERVRDVETPGMHLLGNVVEAPGGYRFYGSGPGGVRSAFSVDGEEWHVEEGVRIAGAGDPGVVRLPDGSYLMVRTERRTEAR